MQMHLLTSFYGDGTHDIKGVFDSREKAQDYVATVMNRSEVKWSDPAHNIHGNIWANSYGSTLQIELIEVNPTE